ncbi:hypothetical protein [Streptomyces sp. NPDC059712]|uniref:hypothetical protein n=1 Tax=Streptomyces sp. NPDC059712 TaxID=3346919 RepID=UPI00369684BF
MASRFTVFGASDCTCSDVAASLGEALQINLSERESSFKGGKYYFTRGPDGVEISVERNVRDEEGVYSEPEFSKYKILVYVNYGRVDVDEAVAAISGLHLLRTENI